MICRETPPLQRVTAQTACVFYKQGSMLRIVSDNHVTKLTCSHHNDEGCGIGKAIWHCLHKRRSTAGTAKHVGGWSEREPACGNVDGWTDFEQTGSCGAAIDSESQRV
jgi:hypothetical protein